MRCNVIINGKKIENVKVNNIDFIEPKVCVIDYDFRDREYIEFDGVVNGWSKTEHDNKLFLDMGNKSANDLLESRGFVSEEEIFNMLGIPSKSGHHENIGWYKNDKGMVEFGDISSIRIKHLKMEEIATIELEIDINELLGLG